MYVYILQWVLNWGPSLSSVPTDVSVHMYLDCAPSPLALCFDFIYEVYGTRNLDCLCILILVKDYILKFICEFYFTDRFLRGMIIIFA